MVLNHAEVRAPSLTKPLRQRAALNVTTRSSIVQVMCNYEVPIYRVRVAVRQAATCYSMLLLSSLVGSTPIQEWRGGQAVSPLATASQIISWMTSVASKL